eukprot:CAMPEP_0205913000 /NCGR_PEP_ID=MMETSP1325-20131115/6223_1 /ASSEMBLY_ACC=CAM_ASM_000708 /TAXON_ID=236786 /ORGANISM="Florenciella sp., Strain RCC1007" /LENGTH=75 /DNA_ID=CAMNT_0053279787 /DNA_START=171 /DNA_END=398 /DNA_ORIENTATION=-
MRPGGMPDGADIASEGPTALEPDAASEPPPCALRVFLSEAPFVDDGVTRGTKVLSALYCRASAVTEPGGSDAKPH